MYLPFIENRGKISQVARYDVFDFWGDGQESM